MKLPRMPIPLIVASGFLGVAALLLLIAYLLSGVPSEEQACQRQCASTKQAGQLVPIFPPEQTAGMRGKGPVRCECR